MAGADPLSGTGPTNGPDPPESVDRPRAGAIPKSYGNMSDDHWSRTRGERNAEAIDYYRDRSHAPGVADGGEARNFYCMECDGVIPWDDFKGDACPHCGAAMEGSARRYFNWVEIDRVPASDRTAVALVLGAGLLALMAVVGLVWLAVS